MHQFSGHLAEQRPQPRRVAEVEVEIVDDENDDAACGIVHRTRHRQDDAFANGRHGCGLRLINATAVHEGERRDLLFDTVLEDVEIILAEVGLKLTPSIPDDDVGTDEIDRRAERRIGLLRRIAPLLTNRVHRKKEQTEGSDPNPGKAAIWVFHGSRTPYILCDKLSNHPR